MHTEKTSQENIETKHPLSAPHPREFTIDDVENLQGYLRGLNERSIRDKTSYVFNSNSLYVHLTEAQDTPSPEARAPEDSFDQTVHSLLSMWGERNKYGKGGPKTVTDTIRMFTDHPELNEVSPIHFQGGAEYVSARFVHVITGRTMGKPREKATQRYYLNPKADAMGYVVDQLAGGAVAQQVPLYFKFVNIATGNPNKRSLARTDRIVIYASDAQTEFVEGLLGTVTSSRPEAFEGRTVAGFGETLSDGVSRCDEVTEWQNQQFKGSSEGISFNSLRSNLLASVLMDVTRDIISDPAARRVHVDEKTIEQHFLDSLTATLQYEHPGTRIEAGDPEIKMALSVKMAPNELKGVFGPNAIRSIDDAIAKTARQVLPRIESSHLLAGFQHHLQKTAPKFGIDPLNLARNI